MTAKPLIAVHACRFWRHARALCLIGLLCCTARTTAADLPARSIGPLVFDLDVCQFEGRQGKTLVEICYAVDLTRIPAPNAASLHALFLIDLLAEHEGDTLAIVHERQPVTVAQDTGSHTARSFVDLKRLLLPPGPVQLHVALRDSISGLSGVARTQLEVRSFSDELSLSDLLLSTHIQRSSGPGNFDRGGVVMVPAPARVFHETAERQQLFVYFQINNLRFDRQAPSTYTITCEVQEVQGRQVYTNTRANLTKSGPQVARIEKIPAQALHTGRFVLTVRVTDAARRQSTSAEVHFTWLTQRGTAEALPMSEADAQKYYDQIKYLASEEERKMYWQLTPRGKQEFLLRFWRERDPTPGTPENEFMLEYFQRLAYCERRFAGKLHSDMARIYIKYGPPLEVAREVSGLGINRPVEVWTYASEGRREFVFVDRTGDGHYVLVHSTHPEEYSNPNWREDFRN